MAWISWLPTHSVNVRQFDEEHQNLIALIDQFFTAIMDQKGQQAVCLAMESIVDYLPVHFANEERLMREHDYPHFIEHRESHNDLLQNVTHLREDLDKDNFVTFVHRCGSLLTEWHTTHIRDMDKRYSEFFNQKGIY